MYNCGRFPGAPGEQGQLEIGPTLFSAVNLWPNAAQAYHHWIKASIGQNKTRWVQPRVRQKWQRREKVGQRRDLAC